MARIENHKYTVEEAFRECFYVVPDYQREYVWKNKQVLRLLEDINEQIELGSGVEYFVGMILVSPSQDRHFEIIDGQQRLTTFFLLLCALRHRFKGEPQHNFIQGLLVSEYMSGDGGIESSLKLEPRYENASDLVRCLVNRDDTPANVRVAAQQAGIVPFGSLENLLNAYETIHDYLLDKYEDNARLTILMRYLTNSVVFIQISTDVGSALKIFETINERGVGLNPMDLLKNLLFAQVIPADFTRLKLEWEKITSALDSANEKPLRFLRYFLMANYKMPSQSSVLREDKIYDWFIDAGNADICGYKKRPFDFVRKILRNVENYKEFSRGYWTDRSKCTPMATLNRLTGEAFSLHYILLLAIAGIPKALFEHFVVQLESFLFYYIYTKSPTRDLERDFSQWADELREIACQSNPAQQRSLLNLFIERRFRVSMEAKSVELGDALRRYNMRSMQQYRTRYLLAKLTQYVDMAYFGISTPGSLEDYMLLQIEHILPNSPDSELLQSFEANNPGEVYDSWKCKLGNLTLLERPINIAASNNFFDLKKAEYLKSMKYLTKSIVELTHVGKNSSVNRINEWLRTFEDWTVSSITERQEMLAELAKEVWKATLIDPD